MICFLINKKYCNCNSIRTLMTFPLGATFVGRQIKHNENNSLHQIYKWQYVRRRKILCNCTFVSTRSSPGETRGGCVLSALAVNWTRRVSAPSSQGPRSPWLSRYSSHHWTNSRSRIFASSAEVLRESNASPRDLLTFDIYTCTLGGGGN